MTQPSYPKPLFQGLIYSEEGERVELTVIGNEPHYVILDDGFRRHIACAEIDRQVIEWMSGQATANKDVVSTQIMGMLGKDDLFTKAMIDSSINKMDQVLEVGLPDDARTMLGMVGFKIIVNVHGEVTNLEVPGQEMPDDDL